MIFSASLDWLARIITLAIVGLGIWSFTQPSIVISAIISSIILLSFALAPRQYELTASALVIHRWIGKLSIDLAEVQSAKHVEAKALQFSIRTFAVGGLFGYYGKFYNSKFGKMSWFCTQRKNFVMLKLKSKKLMVLSPDDIALVDEIEKRLNHN